MPPCRHLDFTMTNEKKQEANPERLVDERFPWVGRRLKAVKLAEIYSRAGYEEYAQRAGSCATWLQFREMMDGKKDLAAANFCQLRLCPMCSSRRAKRAAFKLTQVMDAVQKEHGCRYIFLTLTVKNCEGHDLGRTFGVLTSAWRVLERQPAVERAVKGWYRAIEVTRNRKDGTYHPHIHAVLAVEPEYFDPASGLYITHDEWVQRWRKAARLDYDPRVDIRVTRGKNGDKSLRAATVEAAKYAAKDSDYIDPKLSLEKAAQIVTDYTRALTRRRLTAFGGWLKEAAQRFEADDLENGDLVHIDDDRIREDLADMITTYHWHLGAGDYVLASRELNPLKVVRVDPDTGEVVS